MRKLFFFILFFCALKPAFSQPPTFTCSDTAYLFQGAPTEVYGVDLLTGSSILLHSPLISGAVNTEINATGFNRTDNYIWGVRRNTNQLARIAADFSISLFSINGLPPNGWFNTGDVSANGILHLYSRSTTTFYRVDINPSSPSYLQLLPTLPVISSNISDWAFNPIDGNFYSVSETLELLRFDQLGNLTILGPVTGGGIQNSAGLFGAAFMDALGQLFLSENSSGQIFIVPQTHLGNTVANLFSQGPLSGYNDGAMCSATVISTSIPAPTVNSSPPNCYSGTDGSIQINVTGGLPPYQYQWSNGVSGVNSQTGLPAGTYTVTVTDSAGYIVSDTIVLVDPPPITVTSQPTLPTCFGLNDGSIQLSILGGTSPFSVNWSGSSQSGLQATGLGAGLYAYTATDQNGCTATGSINLGQPPPLQINVMGIPDTICQGDSAQLNASGATQYQWSTGFNGSTIFISPLASGYYHVVGSDLTGCTASDSVLVTVMEKPVPTIRSDSLCLGESFQPSYSVTGGTGQSVITTSWDFGDGNQVVGVNPSHSYLQTGSYTVSVDVTTSMGCVGSATGNVYIRPLPQAILGIDQTEGCEPLTVTFSNQSISSGDPIVQARWLPWGISGSSTYTQAFQQNGTYSVGIEVQTQAGCTDDTLLLNSITVHPQAIAGFSFLNQPLSEFEPRVEIKDESVNATSWQWLFSDGFSSFVPEPEHQLPDTGNYTIVQIVTTPFGCNDTLSKEITVLPEQSIWVPNAFSPNGDNKNEQFTALGRNILDFEIIIVNRWGQEVFKSKDVSSGWDGRLNNKDAPEGVYTYVISYSNIKKQAQRLVGRVTLVR